MHAIPHPGGAAGPAERQAVEARSGSDNGEVVGIVSRKGVLTVFLRKDEDIRADVIDRVFHFGIGIAVNPVTVSIDVHQGEVTVTGQLDLKSQLSLVHDMISHIDGVVDVTVSMTYRHDDTRGHLTDFMATNEIQPPPRVR